MTRSLIALAAACVLGGPCDAGAQSTIYRWTDDNGVVHFSDTGVPGKYAREAEERRVEARPPQRSAHPPEAKSVPLTVRDGNRYAMVTLESAFRTREMLMLVDTGAQMSMIDEELADDLDLEFVREVGIVGVSGVTPGWIGRLQRLKIGDEEVYDLDVMVGPLPGLRLIGTDVLDKLELTIGPDRLHKTR